MLIAPPAAAEIAPFFPATAAAASTSTAVAASCHKKTTRIGLLRWRSMAFDFPAPGKAGGL
jgi:hypothetical protein